MRYCLRIYDMQGDTIALWFFASWEHSMIHMASSAWVEARLEEYPGAVEWELISLSKGEYDRE